MAEMSDHEAIRQLLARYTYNGDRGRVTPAPITSGLTTTS
jgi:hypothetical protein